MAPLLFLSQRIPYPPEKGDKIRAWHILEHLARRFEVHLGCLYDDPDDAKHIAFLKTICADVCCPPLVPWRGKLRSLGQLLRGAPLSLGYFEDATLRAWVETVLARHRPRHVFVFCSAMADYVRDYRDAVRVLDMVDVDSDKWRQYVPAASFPASAIYAREHRTLEAFERGIASEFDATLLVSPAESALMRQLAPAARERILTMTNGIDLDFFDPGRAYANPFRGTAPMLVFTGAMDYRPNIQAVEWLASEILPLARRRWPALEFTIVGLNPAPAVRKLAEIPGVYVTGRVDDVRPYLAHADVVVAPLRIARGLQNKVLEAMAMARPVVATPEACQGIEAAQGDEVLIAASAEDFAARIDDVLAGRAPGIGDRARARVLADYRWNFDVIDALLAGGARDTAEAQAAEAR